MVLRSLTPNDVMNISIRPTRYLSESHEGHDIFKQKLLLWEVLLDFLSGWDFSNNEIATASYPDG